MKTLCTVSVEEIYGRDIEYLKQFVPAGWEMVEFCMPQTNERFLCSSTNFFTEIKKAQDVIGPRIIVRKKTVVVHEFTEAGPKRVINEKEWYLNNAGEPILRYGGSTHGEYIPLTYRRIER